jgi:hypothetical protein
MLRAAMASALFFAVFAWNRLRAQPKNSTHQAMQPRFSLAEMLVSVC